MFVLKRSYMPLRKRKTVLLSHIIAVSKRPYMSLRKRVFFVLINRRSFRVIYGRYEPLITCITKTGVGFLRGICGRFETLTMRQ